MSARYVSIVTQHGMTACQPGTSVSSTTPVSGGARLNVSRYYPDLQNEYGGKGVIKPLDCDGMWFRDTEEARKFSLSRGYSQIWYARSSPEYAYRAAFQTIQRGEYKGKRKLTKWLIAHLDNNQKLFSRKIDWYGKNVT